MSPTKSLPGEVVERPASVVKELLENSLDAGSKRIRINVEAGGKKLIQIIDDGCGMVRDDALLAFERHATSKIRSAEDLLIIGNVGDFAARPCLDSKRPSRLQLGAPAPEDDAGSIVEINGGKKFRPSKRPACRSGISITIRDLFYNIPARP